jgi:hypothetical protein
MIAVVVNLSRRQRMSRWQLALIAAMPIVALPAFASGAGAPLKITTTIDGRKVLPHRIHWVARPSVPASEVASVTFLVDGKVRWTESVAPYTYGDDGNWLVTSWLTPGTHRFASRVTANDARRATTTTIAKVVAALKPPSALNDTQWTREYTAAETGDAPAGTWRLRIDRTGWKITDPNGEGAYIDVAYLSPGMLETRGGIWTKPHNPNEGQAWCEDTNAPVRFTWKIDGDSLTFARTGPSRCDGWGPFMSRTWARAG